MKKRGLWLVVLMLTLALVAVGCGSSDKEKATTSEPTKQAEKSTLDQIKEKGVLVAGLDDTFAPMGFRENNELKGFDIDMGNEIAKRLGVKMQWAPTQWDGVIPALLSKRFDVVISGMTITDERKKQINFSIPYVADGQVMVAKKGTTGINTAADLKGKVVGTQDGSSGLEAVNKIEGLKDKKLYKTYPEAFTDLELGRIPIVVCDRVTSEYYISKRANTFEVVGQQLTQEPMGIAMRKTDPELQQAIDKVLTDMQKDGTLTKISMKWFNKDVTTKAN